MVKEDLSYQKMSQTEEEHLIRNQSICGNLPDFQIHFAEVKLCNKEIRDVSALLESSRQYGTQKIAKCREMLIDEYLDAIKRMQAYASNKNLTDLKNAINYSRTDLIRSNDIKLNDICSNVIALANYYQSDLNLYGITQITILKLQQSVVDYNALLPESEMGKTRHKAYNHELKQLFSRLRTSWKKIDSLMEIIRLDHPDFYYSYHELRKPDSIKSSNVDLSVKIYDKQSGEAVSLVHLSLLPAAGPEQERFEANASLIEKKTRTYGCFFRNLSEGDYTLTARKAGYKETTKTITIVKGEYTAANIVMEKL